MNAQMCDPCERVCQYAVDVGLPEYSGVTNGKCRAHKGFMAHLEAMDARTEHPTKGATP